MSRIYINSSHSEFSQSKYPYLESRIHDTISSLNPKWIEDWEFTLYVMTDEEVRILNRIRRGFDNPTDVLSFPLFDKNSKLPVQIIGDVVISWDRTMEQAKEIGHSNEDEFFRLLVHGILHLFGYDHESSLEDEQLMKSKEDEILKMILGEGDWL